MVTKQYLLNMNAIQKMIVMENKIGIHDFGKFKMVLSNEDTDISPQIRKFGWYEDEKFETAVFEKHLKKDMSVLDLGANIGFYSLLARSIVGQNGRVFSFEPFPENIWLLRKSISENHFTNVFTSQTAVSDKSGTSVLYLSPDACSEHSMLDLDFKSDDKHKKDINVQAVSVDDYFEKNCLDTKIDFIKMDIEGSEFRALNGMKKTLSENPTIMMMTEFWPNGFKKDNKDPQEFLEELSDMGFEIYHIDSQSSKLEKKRPDEIMNVPKYNKRLIEQNKVMKQWGWYTNLLCMRV